MTSFENVKNMCASIAYVCVPAVVAAAMLCPDEIASGALRKIANKVSQLTSGKDFFAEEKQKTRPTDKSQVNLSFLDLLVVTVRIGVAIGGMVLATQRLNDFIGTFTELTADSPLLKEVVKL